MVDLVHIDGGEFSGPAEFETAILYCKDVKYIALDDTTLFKNNRNYNTLLSNSSWKIFKENQSDRNGWAVFVRII